MRVLFVVYGKLLGGGRMYSSTILMMDDVSKTQQRTLVSCYLLIYLTTMYDIEVGRWTDAVI